MSVDPASVVVDYVAYCREPVEALRDFLALAASRGCVVRRAPERQPYASSLNAACRRFLAGDVAGGAAHLLLIDHDVAPAIDSSAAERLLTLDGDIVHGAYRVESSGRSHRDGFGAGCVRISAVALVEIEPPWFWYRVDADGAERLPGGCPCHWFRDRAAAAGYASRCAGAVNHYKSGGVLRFG